MISRRSGILSGIAASTRERFADDPELPLDGGPEHDIPIELCKRLSCLMAATTPVESCASYSKLFGLSFKDRHPRALDTCFEIGIAHCARFEEIDWATEESFELLFEPKIGF